MWTSYKKELFWGLGLFLLIFFASNQIYMFGTNYANNNFISKTATISKTISNNKVISSQPIVSQKPNIKLAFVGDIMLDRGVKSSVYKNFAGDYEELFTKVGDDLQGYDILVGNLEGPISNKGTDQGGVYSFRFEPKTVLALRDVGFDVLSIANNHIFNWGRLAFTDTLANLTSEKINYIGGGFNGNEAYSEKIIDLNGVKIAFLTFSEFAAGGVNSSSTNSGIAVISEDEITRSVSEAKSQADLVVVSYHFGEEYADTPNSFQKKYAELAIDSGADLIIGHHPHVVQTLEQYKNVYIIYSLGNFIFDQYFSKETMQGGILEVEVNSSNKIIEKVTLKKVLLNKYFQIESIE